MRKESRERDPWEAETPCRCNRKINKRFFIPLVCVATLLLGFFGYHLVQDFRYDKAYKLMEAGNYAKAAAIFSRLGDYEESTILRIQCIEKDGRLAYAALLYGQMDDEAAKKKSLELWDQAAVRHTFFAGAYNTIGLKADGTVVVAGGYDTNLSNLTKDWSDIVAVGTDDNYIAALKKDGTVVTTQAYQKVADWKDIVSISTGERHIAGLKNDGTVVTTDPDLRTDSWTDIIAVSIGENHIIGLKADGTVVSAGSDGMSQCNVDDWEDIIAISTAKQLTVGLKKDGTVVATGDDSYGQCDVTHWTDIIAISAGNLHTVGLKKDGTVVTAGSRDKGRREVHDWTDMIAISAGRFHTVGMKKDGTMVSTTYIESKLHPNLSDKGDRGQCDVAGWVDIKIGK